MTGPANAPTMIYALTAQGLAPDRESDAAELTDDVGLPWGPNAPGQGDVLKSESLPTRAFIAVVGSAVPAPWGKVLLQVTVPTPKFNLKPAF
ncbi:hypothetical protein [Streptomyces canus]|uniref:hypothetical protein n=1 Tax=Streptomyces canus TaxID=58343 RepID=UPI002E27291E